MLERKLVNLLILKGYHISFAESMTGGMLASSIVNINNASKVLEKSFVTYSDDAKVSILGIDKALIDKYGVVSEEVALAMILGLERITDANILVSVTGSAGPTSYDGIEVGTVYIGFKIGTNYDVKKLNIKNFGRNYIRKKTKNFIFKYLLEKIQ